MHVIDRPTKTEKESIVMPPLVSLISNRSPYQDIHTLPKWLRMKLAIRRDIPRNITVGIIVRIRSRINNAVFFLMILATT